MVRADLVANQSSLHWFEKGWKIISITKQLYYSFVHFFKYIQNKKYWNAGKIDDPLFENFLNNARNKLHELFI